MRMTINNRIKLPCSIIRTTISAQRVYMRWPFMRDLTVSMHNNSLVTVSDRAALRTPLGDTETTLAPGQATQCASYLLIGRILTDVHVH